MNMKKEFLEKSEEIINIFEELISLSGIDDYIEVDHLGYRCINSDSYELKRDSFDRDRFIYQSIISNRRISVIGLATDSCINTKAGVIKFLEIADQKVDNSQVEGFDHIEFTLKNISKLDFVNDLKSKGFEFKITERPHHTTYDIIFKGYIFKITDSKLIEKIKKEEMN